MFYDRVFTEAAETFSVKRGHRHALTPFSRTWRTILERADHALWTWNDKYGPLTREQRAYAAELVCHALTKARAADSAGDHYAHFHTTLTSLLNHETVDAGFKARAERGDSLAADLIGEFAEVAA